MKNLLQKTVLSRNTFAACVSAMLFSACSGTGPTENGMPYTSDYASLAKAEKQAVPVDSLIEGDLQIVKLDNTPKALVGQSDVTVITDRHIGIYTLCYNTPAYFKLFDRDGNYLRDIGRYGRGPNEYQNILYARIDEGAEKVFILSSENDQMIVYGLDGSFLPAVPLAEKVRRGCFTINADSTITVLATTANKSGIGGSVIWVQDMQGNQLARQVVQPCQNASDAFNVNLYLDRDTAGRFEIFVSRAEYAGGDTLSRYDPKENTMTPLFTMKDAADKEPYFCVYQDLPRYYAVGWCEQKTDYGDGSASYGDYQFGLIDKLTGKGSLYGSCRISSNWVFSLSLEKFRDGYYITRLPAIQIVSSGQVENPDKVDRRLNELAASMDENDNDVVFFAPLKRAK